MTEDNDYIRQTVANEAIRKQSRKGRRYINDPSEAPEGVEVHQGDQGGYYYETTGGSGEEGSEGGEVPGPIDEMGWDYEWQEGSPEERADLVDDYLMETGQMEELVNETENMMSGSPASGGVPSDDTEGAARESAGIVANEMFPNVDDETRDAIEDQIASSIHYQMTGESLDTGSAEGEESAGDSQQVPSSDEMFDVVQENRGEVVGQAEQVVEQYLDEMGRTEDAATINEYAEDEVQDVVRDFVSEQMGIDTGTLEGHDYDEFNERVAEVTNDIMGEIGVTEEDLAYGYGGPDDEPTSYPDDHPDF